VIFLHEEQARSVYGKILAAIREKCGLIEMDIRDLQVAD